MKKLIDIIAGARPNFMKSAAIIHVLDYKVAEETQISCRLIHTGQQYNRNMSDSFSEQLRIPDPAVNFEVGGGS